MPRKQDLSQSVVYHIRRMETKEVVYVGSSCNFTQRQRKHKYNCYNETDRVYNTPIYVYIREQGGFNLFEVVPIAFHKLDNTIQLLILEQNEIDKYPNAMNKNKAYITNEQRQNNAENRNRQKKEWYANNADQIKEHKKEYYAENADRKKEYQKEYYANNADKMKEKMNEKIECPCCNRIIARGCLSRHQKTKICLHQNATGEGVAVAE